MLRNVLSALLVGTAGVGSLLVLSASPQIPPGPPGGFGGPPGPGGPGGFGPGTFMAPRLLEIADNNQDGLLSAEEAARAVDKLIRDADNKKKGSIDPDALGRAINRLMVPPEFAPPDGDGPGGDFGPGTFLAPSIVETADADKDGRLSPDEASSAAAKLIRDSNQPVGLDSDTLADLLNRRMGPPPGF